jgi:hypothetical protein
MEELSIEEAQELVSSLLISLVGWGSEEERC